MISHWMRGTGLATVAVTAIALAAGPAQARGGLKAQTAALTLAQDCSLLPESCDANANVSAVTAYQPHYPDQTTTVWTAIAENLQAGEIYYLFNRDAGSDVCNTDDYHVVLPLVDGNLPNATTLGQSSGEPQDTVDVCRAITNTSNEIIDWVWVLTGTFTGGASSGGKNKHN